MKPYIIHHHDLDGYAAGAIAKQVFPEAECRSMNYDDPSSFPGPEFFIDYDPVVIVDYSLPPETMLWLKENRRFLWIDHHSSATIRSRERGYADAEGLRCEPGVQICGAELAWQYFQKKPIPRFLKLVGDYDTFRNSKTPQFRQEVLPFFYATQIYFEQMKPGNAAKEDYLFKTPECFQDDALCEKLIRQGTLILKFNLNYYRGILRESAFVRNIWGLRVLCFNNAGHGSADMQQAFDPTMHDAMLLFSYNGRKWCYGLYSDLELKPQVNCATIALSYGGGGHKAAAGFSTEKLLPELEF